MPTWDKKTKTWTGNVQRRGFPRKVKKGFRTKSGAKEWERLTWEELQAPRKTVLTCAQAFEQYLSWCEKRRKLNTYRQKAFIIRSLITHLQHNPSIDNLTETNIESYLDFRFKTTGGKSANRDLRELKTAFNWLISRRLCFTNPCAGIEEYEEDSFVRYVPPPEDI